MAVVTRPSRGETDDGGLRCEPPRFQPNRAGRPDVAPWPERERADAPWWDIRSFDALALCVALGHASLEVGTLRGRVDLRLVAGLECRAGGRRLGLHQGGLRVEVGRGLLELRVVEAPVRTLSLR